MLAPIDIADQPEGKLIFLTDGTVGAQAFSVDSFDIADGTVSGYRSINGTPRLIIVVPVTAPWGIIARSACMLRTLEESMWKQKADREQEAVLIKEIFGIDRDLAPTATDALPTVPAAAGHYM